MGKIFCAFKEKVEWLGLISQVYGIAASHACVIILGWCENEICQVSL
jgi:hypothetical protein